MKETKSKEWVYMWSIVRGARQGDIYAERDLANPWGTGYKVVLMKSGKEVPTETSEYPELYDCREIAEEFVQGEEP
jgi:hypothetical protein